MARAQIFISYRRDDSAGYARAVYDELARRFGAERVFIDVDDIRAGQSFVEAIRQAVGESRVLLVLIGKRWLGAREGGTPRLFDAGDFVALEVASGLARGMNVIPLLLDGATMPTAAELPPTLRALAERNALELGNTRFAADMERLVHALDEAIGETVPAASAAAPAATTGASASSRALRLGGVAVGAVALGLLAWKLFSPAGGAGESPSARAPIAVAEVRARVDGAWQADVTYDWPNARFVERFSFTDSTDALRGSASFLGVPRGILEGRVTAGTLSFLTRTTETISNGTAEVTHRYSGRIDGDEIRFVMQTEGGSTPHVPVEFTARRAAAASAPK